jgi:hypothetical protein
MIICLTNRADRMRRLFRILLWLPATLIVPGFVLMVLGVHLPVGISLLSCLAAVIVTVGGVGTVLTNYRLKQKDDYRFNQERTKGD